MSRDNYAAMIELEAAQLPVGESRRTECPSCGGGTSHERSLLITREPGGLRAHCFRATCGFFQRVTGGAGTTSDVPPTPAQESTQYFGTFEGLDDADRAYFRDRFHLELKDVQSWIGHNDRNEYVMPIWNRFELRTGYVVRQKPWDGPIAAPRQPRNPYSGMARKVRAWPDTPETVMLSVYPAQFETLADPYAPPQSPFHPGTIVLTEDQISAMKAAQEGFTGVALLGVGLNFDKVRELQRLHPKRVLVALDPDASALSFQMVNKWSAAFPYMRAVLLDQDLKDMKPDDVLEVLGRGV